jgi:hypothetical protein
MRAKSNIRQLRQYLKESGGMEKDKDLVHSFIIMAVEWKEILLRI